MQNYIILRVYFIYFTLKREKKRFIIYCCKILHLFLVDCKFEAMRNVKDSRENFTGTDSELF